MSNKHFAKIPTCIASLLLTFGQKSKDQQRMNIEDPQVEITDSSPEPKPEKKSNKRRNILIGVGSLILLCICLWATGIIKFNTDFYAGGVSIEDVIVTNELGSDGRPVGRESKLSFEPTGRIDTAVYTSGIDATVGMRWYHDDTLLFELFERTQNNYIATFLEGSSRSPLPSGEYRVEVHLGENSSPVETVEFIVEDFELEIIPPQPTPEGHVDIENSPYLEIPFVFDEIWETDDREWHISEAKIVFLSDAELFVVVVETDLDFTGFSENTLEILTRPIAQYAVENGYWEEARQIQINGETYKLDEPIAITLINPEKPNQGYRVRFDVEELKSPD